MPKSRNEVFMLTAAPRMVSRVFLSVLVFAMSWLMSLPV